MKEKLLEILACPACQQELEYRRKDKELVCAKCKLAYPVRDDIPVLLIDQARECKDDEF